jgi:hypothetical protein
MKFVVPPFIDGIGPGSIERNFYILGIDRAVMEQMLNNNTTFAFQIKEFGVTWKGQTMDWGDLVEHWTTDTRDNVTLHTRDQRGYEQLLLFRPAPSVSARTLAQHLGMSDPILALKPCESRCATPRATTDFDRYHLGLVDQLDLGSVQLTGEWLLVRVGGAGSGKNLLQPMTPDQEALLKAGSQFDLSSVTPDEIAKEVHLSQVYRLWFYQQYNSDLFKDSNPTWTEFGGADRQQVPLSGAPVQGDNDSSQVCVFGSSGHTDYSVLPGSHVTARWRIAFAPIEQTDESFQNELNDTWLRAGGSDVYIHGPRAQPGFTPKPGYLTFDKYIQFLIKGVKYDKAQLAHYNSSDSPPVTLFINLFTFPSIGPINLDAFDARKPPGGKWTYADDGTELLEFTASSIMKTSAPGYEGQNFLRASDLCFRFASKFFKGEQGIHYNALIPDPNYIRMADHFISDETLQPVSLVVPTWGILEVSIDYTLNDYMRAFPGVITAPAPPPWEPPKAPSRPPSPPMLSNPSTPTVPH